MMLTGERIEMFGGEPGREAALPLRNLTGTKHSRQWHEVQYCSHHLISSRVISCDIHLRQDEGDSATLHAGRAKNFVLVAEFLLDSGLGPCAEYLVVGTVP